MFLDAHLRLSAAQLPTQGTTTVTTNALDLAITGGIRLGDGEPMVLAFFIEAITASADTYSFEVISATGADLTGTVTRHVLRGPFAAAEIPAGTIVVLDIPIGQPRQRYIGGRYTLGASDALTVSAYILPRSFVQALNDYPSGVIID